MHSIPYLYVLYVVLYVGIRTYTPPTVLYIVTGAVGGRFLSFFHRPPPF